MTYPIIAKIAEGQGRRGTTIRATVNGEDITREIAYTTLKGAFEAGCDLVKETPDSKWSRVPMGELP